MRREEGGKEEGEGGGRRRGRRREEGGRFQEHHGSVGFLPGPKSIKRLRMRWGTWICRTTTPRPRRRATWPASCWRTPLGPSWIPSSRPPSCSTGPAREPKPRSTTPSPARASSPKRRPTRGGQRQRKLRVPGAHQRDAPNDQGAPASGAPGGQRHPLGHHARAHLRRLHQNGSGRALFEQQQLRAARRQVLPQQPVGGRGQRPLPPRPGAVHAPLHPQPALLPPPSSLLPPPPSSLLPPSSSLLPPPPSPLLRPPPSSESAQGWARHHSESDPTRPIPAEGSPASSRMGTAPQRERSDTPDPRRGFAGERSDTPNPRRGFAGELKDSHGTTARALRHARSPQRVHIGELKDSHGTTPIPAEGSPASDPTRPIPAEGSPASSRIRTAPQRERSDTPDPRRGFTAPHRSPQRVRRRAIRHARSPQRVRRRAQGFARHHSESAPTRPIPAEGSSASSRIRGTTARAIRHARSPQRVHRRAQGFARHHSESAPTRPIPVEGSSASSRMGTAPQRERANTPDPCRGFIGELRDGHRRRPQGFARHHNESAPTRPIPAEGSSASSRMSTAPQRERSDTPDPCRGFIGELKDSHGTTARALRHARSL